MPEHAIPRSIIRCPKCDDKFLKITGHNPDSWHVDKESGSMIRQVYVTCPCNKSLIQQTETLEQTPKAKKGSMRLTTETRTLPMPTQID